jgi:polyhydroxyalkanoate synthesis regulator phasin
LILATSGTILTFLLTAVLISATPLGSYASTSQLTSSQSINGVAMKGAFVNMKQEDSGSPCAPRDYIEDSLKMISGAGLNHVRFVFYWEAYERDPKAFMKEIQSVARAADKYGVKIIYDNHQWHTSSWLEDRGTGFPWSLIQGNSEYSRAGGGNTHDKAAQVFWADWWDRSVKDNQGRDGWTLMAEFLKEIVLAVDNHPSTLGYEILSEPHVHNKGQWSKIGKFNSFITTELRNITSKTIVYSMNVPVDLNSPIKISPKNLAKMAPSSKENTAFKVSVYGDPDVDGYQEKRFDMFLKTMDLTGVPLYIGEWNNVVRTKEGGVSKLNPGLSEFTKTDAKQILEALKKAGVWGTAFWRWDYQEVDTDSFNLVSDNNGKLVPTKYLGILKDTVETIYGSSGGTSTPDVSTSGRISTPDDAKQNNLINELVKTGKFTENEAKELITKSMQHGTDTVPTTDTTTTSNIDTSANETHLSNNEDNDNINSNQSPSTNTDNAENYDNLNELVDDIKNCVVDTDEISLNAFKDSRAYQGADENTQDCIDLAAKIGGNLIDYEIVRCSEDTNFFQNQIAYTDDNDDNNDDNNDKNDKNDNNADDTGN